MKKNESYVFNILRILAVLLVISSGATGQNELNVIPDKWIYFSDAPNSLYRHISEQAVDMLGKRTAEVSRLNSLAGWKLRQQKTKKILSDIIGPFPVKTPLNARVVRTVEKDGFRFEHILFESQPGFYVTSSLFLPGNLTSGSKAPVVIYCSGHSAEGYRSAVYMHVILNLVKKGFIVFAFDPVGQGERLQYYDPQTGKSLPDGPTKEHSYPGAQLFISGSSLARYMIWDGIRAVDYLFTRKEVDTTRIGITGRSGGGTQSAYIAAMDDRIVAAAPECYITNFTRLFQTIGPQDAEQNLFNGIKQGIDHADLLLVRAPKPALMITTTRDMFSIQGAMETEKEISRAYKAFGKEDNFGRAEDDAPHESTKKNREAMYAFFRKHLNNPGSSGDEETPVISAGDLQVTAAGQVCLFPESETVFSLNCKETEKAMSAWQARRSDLQKHLPGVLHSAGKLSGFREPVFADDPVFCGRIQKQGYVIEKYFIRGEGDYIIPYLILIPEVSNHKAVIYLHPSGKIADAEGEETERFVRNGFTVLAPDMIGTGETGPGNFKGDAYIGGISHNVWYGSMLTGRSIVGIRSGDVVRLVMLLKKDTALREVYGLAIQEMSPVLLHAAAFDRNINGIALIEPLSSYGSIVMNRYYDSRYIPATVPGALLEYDLPDLAATLAPRKLMMSDIRDGNGKRLSRQEISKEYGVAEKAYESVKASDRVKIIFGTSEARISDVFINWIK